VALKDDLIQRTVEQLADVIRVVVNLKTSDSIASAEETIATAYQQHTGSSASLFRQLSTEQLVAMLSSSGNVDREKAYVLAVIFYSDAQLQKAKGDDVDARLLLNALDLFLEAGIDDGGEDDVAERIATVQADLSDFVLPESTHWRQLDYAKYTGRFSAAEDKLYAMLAEFGASDSVVANGRELYSYLLQQDDDDLEKGDLPRDEVEEGRQDFEAQLTELSG